MVRLDLVICTHQSRGRNLCFVSVLCPGGPSFLPANVFCGAKDRSSFGPQSITTTSRHVSAKNATRSVQIHQGFVILMKIPQWFPYLFQLNSLRFIGDKFSIHHKRPLRENESKTAMREEIAFSWGGGTGNVQDKTVLINCSGIAAQDGYGSGISTQKRNKPELHCRNTFFQAAYYSAVLRVWSCDSSVAQYSRSDARSA
jgi:hypothetical protein